MAKLSRSVLTRIVTTINAKYFPVVGAKDLYYLDGRFTGSRESQSSDITTDREDGGFYFSVFATQNDFNDERERLQMKKRLDHLSGELKADNNIDEIINDLAQNAMETSGKLSLQQEGVKPSYYSGVIIKDGEIAAITMSGGCAYLYRDDILYPLTSDDYTLEAIDAQGHPIKGLEDYCAGVAGTIRYSNIAKLNIDDCFILCNKETIEAVGQREMLQLLGEAQDQSDAAANIIAVAAAKAPGVPLQCMIGYVENISTGDKTARLGVNKFAAVPSLDRQQADETKMASAAPISQMPLEDQNHVPKAEDVLPKDAEVFPTIATDNFSSEPENLAGAALPLDKNVFQPPTESLVVDVNEQAEQPQVNPVMYQQPSGAEIPPIVQPDYSNLSSSQPQVNASNHIDQSEQNSYVPNSTYQNQNVYKGGNMHQNRMDAYEDDFDYDDEYDDYKSGKTKKIIFFVILGLICATCIFLILKWTVLNKNDDTVTTTPPTLEAPAVTAPIIPETTADLGPEIEPEPEEEPGAVIDEPVETTAMEPVTTPTTQAGAPTQAVAGNKHVIEAGDTLYGLAVKAYGNGSEANVDKIRKANNLAEDATLQIGQELVIPAP